MDEHGRPFKEWLAADPAEFRRAVSYVVYESMRGHMDDVVQETCVAALNSGETFPTQERALAFAVTIARRYLHNLSLAVQREVPVADPAEADTRTHDGGLGAVLDRDQLKRLLAQPPLTRAERVMLGGKAY